MKYNLSKIWNKRAYSIKEICNLLSVNRRTIFRWITEGMPLLDASKKPLLIMGYDLKVFIRANREAKKAKLQLDEFYCLTCKKAVKAKSGTQKLKKTGKKIGKANKDQEIFCAKCKECGGNITRFF